MTSVYKGGKVDENYPDAAVDRHGNQAATTTSRKQT
jgi:hypothetical protein